jgi:hypothetical protein
MPELSSRLDFMVVRPQTGSAGHNPRAGLRVGGLTQAMRRPAPASGGMFAWYLRRAAAMSPRELGHRLVEQCRRSISRLDGRGWDRFDLGDGPLEPLPALTILARVPWPAGLEEAASRCPPSMPLKFLGQTWPAADSIDRPDGLWHRDPVTGASWPGAGTFCFDVRWREATDKSDVKFVLELNRLQQLHAAAARAMRDGDGSAARMAAEVLTTWMEANPPFRGVNWLSGIELALRVVSAAFVVAALDVTLPGHGYRRTFRSFVAAHAYWLDRFPSVHSSANNHLVAEGLGLVVASELVPDLPERYGRSGRAILAEAARTQFYDDGTGVEQSPTYAAFTLEMLLLGIVIERSRGREPTEEVGEAIARAAAHLNAMLDSGGRHPRIGDDDEGRVIATSPEREDRYVASVVAGAASVLLRPDIAPPVRPSHLRDLLFEPPAHSAPAPDGVLTFRSGGYSVIRERISRRAMLLVMDHGPVGFDPLAAHGHADALAIWLHLDDQPVFVDAGTYRYNASDGWREWLRSTPAHNTLCINGESQSLAVGGFNWRHKAKAELVSLDFPPRWCVKGQHDGYVKRFGVVHRRTCRRAESGVLIEDTLTPPRIGLEVVIGFLVHPTLTVTPCWNGAVVSKDGEELVRVTSCTGAPALVATSERTDCPPVYSPAYNSLVPATRIEFRPSCLDAPHGTLVEIVPRGSPAPSR